MYEDLDKVPATMLDVAIATTAVTIEIVAALRPSGLANDLLTDIANRLDDLAQGSANKRSSALIAQIARNLIATESS